MKTKEVRKFKTKDEISEHLNNGEVPYFAAIYHGCDRFFIPTSDSENCCTYPGIAVTMCNKDICTVYPHEILYIAIEDRKSVLYLTDRKIETHCSMDYWKEVLDEKSFTQPHYSYLVNLNYVEEVTKDFVKVKYMDREELVYTSSRKIGAFKKAVMEFGCGAQQGEK